MSTFTNSILLPLLTLTLGVGCAEDAPNDVICGGHGEMHGSHCHCDSGFTLSEDGNSCEAASDTDSIEYGGDFVFEPSEVHASTDVNNNAQFWILQATDEDVQLKIEIYEDYGGLSSPGNITLDAVETNYATCGTCLLLQTGCNAHGDHFHCERTLMPMVGGEVNIDEIGRNSGDVFAGQLLGVIFQEVTIDQNFQTQPVDNGMQHDLAPWSFEAILD